MSGRRRFFRNCPLRKRARRQRQRRGHSADGNGDGTRLVTVALIDVYLSVLPRRALITSFPSASLRSRAHRECARRKRASLSPPSRAATHVFQLIRFLSYMKRFIRYAVKTIARARFHRARRLQAAFAAALIRLHASAEITPRLLRAPPRKRRRKSALERPLIRRRKTRAVNGILIIAANVGCSYNRRQLIASTRANRAFDSARSRRSA